MAAFTRRKESQEDAEDYWGSSRAKSSKKVNMFDDDVSVEAASHLAKSRQLLNSDGDDDDMIEWDGTASSSITSKSTPKPAEIPYKAGKSSAPTTPTPNLTLTLAPSTSPQFPRAKASMTHTRSQSASYGVTSNVTMQANTGVATFSKSQEGLTSSNSSSNLSIHEIVAGSAPKNQTSEEKAQMKEQIKYLQRCVDNAKQSGTTKMLVEDTIRFIVTGEPFRLEMYKAKEEKLSLLDKAIDTHDGNAIITILLFLKRTVKTSIFNQELIKRPEAVNHYLSFLKAHYDFQELVDLLGMLGRHEEAAMFKYKLAVSTTDVRSKLRGLDSCLKAHFVPEPTLSHDTVMLQQHMSLLERQRPIEEADAKDEAEGKVIKFKQYPRKQSIINMSVITTLYYCCFYHADLSENNLASPEALKKEYQLTDKQFTWIALSVRSRLKQWNGVEKLLTAKSWLGGMKAKASIGFDRVCEVLYQTSAPLDILSKYLRLVDDTDKRLCLAKRMKCHDIVVDTYVALKDRVELQEYTKKLNSRDFNYAQDALRSSTVKWKN